MIRKMKDISVYFGLVVVSAIAGSFAFFGLWISIMHSYILWLHYDHRALIALCTDIFITIGLAIVFAGCYKRLYRR